MKNILISGGMGGIGRAMVSKLTEDGHRVCVLYHTTPKKEVEAFLKTLGGNGHLALVCDLTDGFAIKKTVDEALKTFEHIDVCIHAAVSKIVRKNAVTISVEEFRREFDITLFAALALFRAVIPSMKKQRSGRLIGITTSALDEGESSGAMAGYLAAKQALRATLRELSKELAPVGVMVNAIAPGFVPTTLHDDLPPQVLKFIVERTKTTTPQAVAEVASFLCSEKVASITGKSFSIGKSEPTAL